MHAAFLLSWQGFGYSRRDCEGRVADPQWKTEGSVLTLHTNLKLNNLSGAQDDEKNGERCLS